MDEVDGVVGVAEVLGAGEFVPGEVEDEDDDEPVDVEAVPLELEEELLFEVEFLFELEAVEGLVVL